MEDYEQLSKEVVSYAGGLPLALKVLRSFLCDKSIHRWRSVLARLKEIPDVDILEKLKISFDGLTKVQKDLFLDIACFYRWEEKDATMEILDACGFHPVIGVEELRQKALITITDGLFVMHDLVQEMGLYIVRGEHPNNPEKHTRIWRKEYILRICAMDSTAELDMIEAISFGCAREEHSSQLYPSIVANMKNLRWIYWKGDLANPLPTNFPPRELCGLIFNGISQKQLWKGYKYLPNLKIMELRDMEKLIVTPKFDGLPNLERFTLYGSLDLKEIHSSFEKLDKIISLRIEACPSINKFPSITQLKKLDTLSFSGCPRLFEMSEPLIQNLCFCLPHNNINHIQLCVRSHRNLRMLDLSICNLGDQDMRSAVWELPNLQELDLSHNKFSRLNFSLMRLPRLKFLNVNYCSNLVEFSQLPSTLAALEADYCHSLRTLGDISNCKWLSKVWLRRWDDEHQPLVDGDILLDSMLKGNAIEDHHISIILPHHQIQNEDIVGGLFKGNTFTIHLPHDWYIDFCGFFIHLVTHDEFPYIDIIVKQGVDKDPPFEHWQESNEAPEPEIDEAVTYVGYVSFGSLRRSVCFNATYNLISFSLRPSPFNSEPGWDRLGAALVPRKTKDPLRITKIPTDCS